MRAAGALSKAAFLLVSAGCLDSAQALLPSFADIDIVRKPPEQ
jgi:hypothetical protein